MCRMRKVDIIEKFSTSLGTILLTDETGFSVGDKIVCSDGKEYTIKGIQMCTKPENTLGLIV